MEHFVGFTFPGEAEAVATVERLGAEYGYGNLIYRLRIAWAKTLREKHGIKTDLAEHADGLHYAETIERLERVLRDIADGPSKTSPGGSCYPARAAQEIARNGLESARRA